MPSSTNARPWLGIRLLIADDLDLIVDVKGPKILVRSRTNGFCQCPMRSSFEAMWGISLTA
jgi:hypothetical protein